MSKLVDQAIDAMRGLQPAPREELARLVLRLAANEDEPEVIDPAHLPAVLEGLAQAKSSEFASEADVAMAFQRFGP